MQVVHQYIFSTQKILFDFHCLLSLYFLLLISDSTCRERTLYKKSDNLVMMKPAKLILFL